MPLIPLITVNHDSSTPPLYQFTLSDQAAGIAPISTPFMSLEQAALLGEAMFNFATAQGQAPVDELHVTDGHQPVQVVVSP